MSTPYNIKNALFIKELNSGKKRAFEALFKLYYEKLLFIASSYTLNKEDAEEIVQDVFVKVWEKRANITTNVNGYILKTTKNACLDYLRSKKYKLSKDNHTVKLEAVINFEALNNDASTAIIEKELENNIQLSIASLPKKCRAVFIKSRIDGLKNKEISEELDISIKTVENHITKALKHIKMSLRDFLHFF